MKYFHTRLVCDVYILSEGTYVSNDNKPCSALAAERGRGEAPDARDSARHAWNTAESAMQWLRCQAPTVPAQWMAVETDLSNQSVSAHLGQLKKHVLSVSAANLAFRAAL